MHEINVLWIPIVAILMPLMLAPTLITLKHRRLKREWQHKERMKAMEMGLPVPGSAAASVAAIGAGVPIASVITAAITCLSYHPTAIGDEVPVFGITWGCAFVISVLGMATSLILAHIQNRGRKESESTMYATRNGKPIFDPDAYDVVSSRA